MTNRIIFSSAELFTLVIIPYSLIYGLQVSYDIAFRTECVDDKYIFHKFLQVSLDQCVIECVRRPLCLAISFCRRLTLCNLVNTDGLSEMAMTTSDKVACDFITKSDMRYKLPAGCQECKDGQNCDVENEKCTITECHKLSLDNGVLLGNMNGFGKRVRFMCNNGYKAETEETYAICEETGNWSITPKCLKDLAIETCQDLKKCNARYTNDGHYWLYPVSFRRQKIKVYCHNQAASNPTEYISVSDETNVVYDAGYDTDPPFLVKFRKIRLNPKNMTIDTQDLVFATSTTGSFSAKYRPYISLGYGMALSCIPTSKGTFKIDTTGTGVIIDTSITWYVKGYEAGMSDFSRTSGGAIISASCGGYCGWCTAGSTLSLQFNPSDVVTEDGVTTPQCV